MLIKPRQYQTKTIAFYSPERGLGVTHISLCFAHSLAASGKRVALIEWNPHQDFAEIEKSFRGFGFEKSNAQSFRIRKVDYYKEYQEKGLAKIRKENYDYIIIDMGSNKNDYFAEADYPILVVVGSEWKSNRLVPAVKAYQQLMGERLRLIINFGNREEKNFFSKCCSFSIYNFPFWKDAFSSDAEQRKWILQMLE